MITVEAKCPLCGHDCWTHDETPTGETWCSSPWCEYRATNRAAHETLCRHAEAGRLVEENAAKTTRPISITQDEQGWHVAWDWTRIMRDSLPDALRALADKLKENNR